MSHLSESQRYTISVLKKAGYKQNKIAELIGKNKSVISMELKRNRDGRSGEYNPDLAQRKYEKRLLNKPKAVAFTPAIKKIVEEKICLKLSPEQVVGVCKVEGIDCVSIETIYKHIWSDKKNNGFLYEHLRTRGKRYRDRGNSKDSRGIIRDRKPIEERPLEVEKKERFGDLEIDTIIGQNHKGAIVTINDRATGIFKMKKVDSKDAQSVRNATIEMLQDWKPYIFTITSDNGKEFALHGEISKALNIDFYFANPYHSWERGANENLNGLIRQYIPKKTNFETLSHKRIKQIQEEINNRPRKRYNFKSPKFMFKQKVAFVS